MVVDEDYRGGALAERRPQDLARVDQRRRLGADRYLGVHQVVVLRVEEHREEVLLVVVAGPHEVEGKEGCGGGIREDPWRGLAGFADNGPCGEPQAVAHAPSPVLFGTRCEGNTRERGDQRRGSARAQRRCSSSHARSASSASWRSVNGPRTGPPRDERSGVHRPSAAGSTCEARVMVAWPSSRSGRRLSSYRNSTVPSGLTKIDAAMLGSASLAQVVLAGSFVLDGSAESLLEVARQGVAARTRVPLSGDLHLARRVDVDEDRRTWHRNLLARRAKLLDHQLNVPVLLDPLQDAPAGALDGADRRVHGVAVLETAEVRHVAPAPVEVIHADRLGRLDDDRVLPTRQLDHVTGVRLLVVEHHAAMLEREPELAARIGEGLAVPELNLNGRGVAQRWTPSRRR